MNYFTKLDTILSSSSSNSENEGLVLNDIILAYLHEDKEFAINLFFRYKICHFAMDRYDETVYRYMSEIFIEIMSKKYSEFSKIINFKSKQTKIQFYSTTIAFDLRLQMINGASYKFNLILTREDFLFSNAYITINSKEKIYLKGYQSSKIRVNDLLPLLRKQTNRIKLLKNIDIIQENKFILTKNIKIPSCFLKKDAIKYLNLANNFYNEAIKGTKFDIYGKKHFVNIYDFNTFNSIRYETNFLKMKQEIDFDIFIDGNFRIKIQMFRKKKEIKTSSYKDCVRKLREELENYKLVLSDKGGILEC